MNTLADGPAQAPRMGAGDLGRDRGAVLPQLTAVPVAQPITGPTPRRWLFRALGWLIRGCSAPEALRHDRAADGCSAAVPEPYSALPTRRWVLVLNGYGHPAENLIKKQP